MNTRARAVFLGGVAPESSLERELAYACGRLIGGHGYVLLHGGYNGLMEDAARGASEAGAEILAVTLAQKEVWGSFNPHVQRALYLPDMGQRLNAFFSQADVVIAMGGGVGTLHEITAAIWYAGNVRRIPVILLGARAERLLTALKQEGWIYESPTRPVDFLHVASSITALETLFDRWEAGPKTPREDLAPLRQRVIGAAMVEGSYVRADGARLDRYFSPFRLGSDPRLLYRAAMALATEVRTPVDLVAGVALGGASLATLVASILGKSLLLLRPSPKQYGTFAQVEGLIDPGGKALMVDDVVRRGGTILAAREALKAVGVDASEAACLACYGHSAREHLRARGVNLHSLICLGEGAEQPTDISEYS